MKKLIDANVILRYLLSDHPEYSERARKVIAEGAYTLPEVIAEVVYVLKGVYKVGRGEISNTLIDFMDEVAIDNQEVITLALSLYSDTTLGVVDCILLACHRITGVEVISFDKKLNRNLER